MRHHLTLIEQPSQPRRLDGRQEIDRWVAERYRVLTALVETERAGHAHGHGADRVQLQLGEVA